MFRQEQSHQSSPWAWVDQFRQDSRHSLRQLRRAPAFAATVVLTLALGIGATTVIFTLIHAVLLKSLPVERPSELYAVGDAKRFGVYSGIAGTWELFSYDLYRNLRDNTAGFETLAAFQSQPRRIGVRRNGDPRAAEPLTAEYVSGNYFSMLGSPVLTGRAISDDDDRAGAPGVAVIAYRTWSQRYGLDPFVIGATFNLNGAPVKIVGAMPPAFFGDTMRGDPPDFWLPLADEPAVNRGAWLNNPKLHWLYLMGRVKPGVNVRAIESQMQIQLRQWLAQSAGVLGSSAAAEIPRQTLHLQPAASGMGVMRGTYSAGLKLLMAIAAFVLMIVCANLANLMLVRGLGKRRDTSISLALGASRWRIVRQALTESVILGLVGGVVGIAIAFGGTKALLGAVFGAAVVPISATPDFVVLAFALSASVLTGLIFGIAPAWSANRAHPIEALRGSGRSTDHTGSLAQRGLVIVQAALSIVLLTATGLLSQSLRNLERQKFGFAPDQRVAVRIDPNLAGYKPEQLETLYRTIRERLARLPGVVGVSYVLWSPMSGSSWTMDVDIDGQPLPTKDGQNLTSWNRVGPDYFETIGTPILIGRPILESDTATTRHVTVINEAFARRFFPGEDPIGRHIVGDGAKFDSSYEIVGIAADAKYRQPDQPTFPMFFVPRAQMTQYANPGSMAFESRSLYAQDIVLHFFSGADSSDGRIRQEFAQIDPNLPLIRIQTFGVATTGQFNQETLIVQLTSLFGVTALLLASIGLYGVTSYSVARRSKEIGIRVALGAERLSIVKMVLCSAYALVAIGLVFGIPLSVGLGRIVASRLYGIVWYNPAILAAAAIVLALCAFAATVIPARRAASVDPVQTLRGE